MISSAAIILSVLALATALPQHYVSPLAIQQYVTPSVYFTSQPKPVIVAKILTQEQESQENGSFKYGFEADNGIALRAAGSLKNPGTKDEALVVQGGYTYTAPDGQVVTITYVADDEGFKPQGNAIPTSPPIPEAIARSLEYLRTLPPDPREKNYS